MTCTVAAAPATAESQAQIAELVRLVDYGQDVGEVRFYELKTGDIITVPFDADGSAEYYINGNCDADCSNLDLVVMDSDGSVADIDDFDDNGPVLNVRPAGDEDTPKDTPRPMVIEIRMVACAAEVCTAGMGIKQVVSVRVAADKSQREFYVSAEDHLRRRTERLTVDPVADMTVVGLDEGETERVELALDATRSTFLIAACDDDCLKGVTLRAFDSAGNEIANYLADDGKAFLEIPPGSGSSVSVEIGMMTCISYPCGAAVQPFVVRSKG